MRAASPPPTCFSCRWSFAAWSSARPGEFPTHHLRCWPEGKPEREQAAGPVCLKYQRDAGADEPEGD